MKRYEESILNYLSIEFEDIVIHYMKYDDLPQISYFFVQGTIVFRFNSHRSSLWINPSTIDYYHSVIGIKEWEIKFLIRVWFRRFQNIHICGYDN